ncbi:MAG TPA: Asp-tRNA(Asn)/Glu-tRNA(Gln) amidotransferase subunit GatB [Firmicutes bacterium]|nr:Asp-tRNA(Asn)/Glu-tRNA(Gln) amidotransferase subunit GatB [Bacillota bacterium]
MDAAEKYEVVIGIEVHAELNTNTKMFCGCSVKFGASPNTNICEVCLGLPGSLPAINESAVHHAVLAGLSMNCEIPKISKFDRKNYYYPDLPKAYQISQFDMPVCGKGFIEIVNSEGEKKRIGITRIHLEEDAGKLIHLTKTGQIGDAEESLVDYNRGGVPLIEIVSDPDIRSAEEARLYLDTLKSILKYINVSDCNMEEGSLRADANVSIMPKGSETFGKRVEIKNMNSFNNVKKALEYEIQRQVKAVESGEIIKQETRLWDINKGKTFSMRSKEESHDYRYFPEPDLPFIELEDIYIENIRKELPELPVRKMERFVKEHKIPLYDAFVLTQEAGTADFYEAVVKESGEAKLSSNWIMVELPARMKEAGIKEISASKITPPGLGKMIGMIKKGTISGKIAKAVFDEMFVSGKDPEKIVQEKGLVQISDAGEIEKIVDAVIAANMKVVEEIKGGKDKGLGFLVGQVMKESKGKANPGMVNSILRKKISG